MATLDDVDDALYAALETLQRDDENPARLFALVTRFTGQVQMTPGGITLQREAMGRLPAVLWQWVGEEPTTRVRTLLGARQDIAAVQWVAWVLMQDPRGAMRQVKGTTGAPGVHALTDAVVAALNGFVHADLFQPHRVRFSKSRAFMAERSVHVTQLTFEALRELPQVVPTVSSVAPIEVDADVNLPFEAGEDNPDNPRVEFLEEIPEEAP